jgi:hypothetical protein
VKAEKTNESVLIKYETMFENDLNFFIDLFLLLLYMCWRPFKGAPVGGGSGLEGGGAKHQRQQNTSILQQYPWTVVVCQHV